MGNFLEGVWNWVVSIAPTVLHAACEIVNGAANATKLGG